jgi:predicted dehydrogenase
MTSVRVGLSGCTQASLELVQRSSKLADCDIGAVHDDDAAALAHFQAVAPRGFATTNYDALLGTGVDFVILAGDASKRTVQVEAAAAQGAHCLLTSPFADDLDAAVQMAGHCQRAGTRLGVHVPDLEDPRIEQLRRMIAGDWLGGIVAVQSMLGDDLVLQGAAARRHPLVDLTSRHVHLASWLCGRRAARVTAQTMRSFSREDDSAVATAILRGNVACTFTATHAANVNAFAVHGTDGGVRLAGDRLWLLGRREYRGEVFDYLVPGHELSLSRAELAPELQAHAPASNLVGRFARWIEDRDDYPCPVEQALDDWRVVDAMLRAVREGRAVTLEWPVL